MKKPTVRKPRYIGAKIALGTVLAVIGLVCVLIYVDFESTAVHVNGKVVDLRSESHATGRKGGRVTITRPMVEFDDPATNTHHKAVAKVASRNADLERGQTIAVEFDPRSPDESVRVESGLSFLEVGVLVAGLMLIGFALKEQFTFRRATRALAAG